MRLNPFSKIIALVSLMAVLLIAIAGKDVCFAGAGDDALGASSGTTDRAILKANSGGGIPCCPDDGGPAGARCGSCLSCPCHAPLSMQRSLMVYVPLSADMYFLEYLNASSDVYRSIFVPPQNLV